MSKITIDRALLEQAIAALSYCEPDWKENTHGFDLWANVLPPLREALAQQPPPPPPPECRTEAERTAYAFGWFKALETVNQKKEVK